MIVYILIIILLLLLSLKYDFRTSSKGKERWGAFVLFVFIFLSGFRGDIGGDTMVYHQWYDSLGDNLIYEINNTRFEPLFVLCCSLLKIFGCSWLIIQIVLAIWINYYMYRYIRKYTNLLFLPLLLYFLAAFYYLNCEEIRGAIAFGFVLMALPYLERRKYMKYCMLVLIGCGFHYSNALFLILPFVPNIFKNKLVLGVVLGICFIGANFLQTRFGVLAMLIDGFLGVDTVSSYIDGDYADASGKLLMNLVNIFAIGVFFPLLSYFISKNTSTSINKIFFLYIFCIIGSMALPLFYRYNHQLSIVYVVVLCRALDRVSLTHKLLPRFVVGVCLILLIYSSITNYISYNSFLDGYFYENFVPYTVYDI